MIRSAGAGVALAVAVALFGGAAGCHEKDVPMAPPPPLRPEPDATPLKAASNTQKDCEPVDAGREPKPFSFDERSIPEGARLADQGRSKLRAAQSAEVTRASREDMLTQAVDDFITALRADPYNIEATYSLAAAYATIGRYQCTINLLTRLLQMRPHAFKHAEVESHIDRLLGRKQALDPDFAEMRKDDRFRALIQKMCEGTNDANCVYGAQRENRER
jgi:hypothetical protein